MMLSGDKRASLSSNLLDGKDGGASEGAAKADAKLRETVLYNKGAASASGFRPRSWSYDAQPVDPAATVTPFPVPRATPARESVATNSRARLAMLGLAVFSAVALIASASLFFVSRTHDSGIAAAPAATIVTAAPAAAPIPAPAPTIVLPTSEPPAPAAAAEEPVRTVEAPADSAPQPDPSPPEEKSTVASRTPLAPAEIEELVTRGGRLLATGDIAAARIFFERAAEQGNAAAATAAGKTYDPIYLEEAHVRGIRGDPVAAAKWYRRASAAGDREADLRMQKLIARYAG